MENYSEILQFVTATRCTTQQTTKIPQHLVISEYKVLYPKRRIKSIHNTEYSNFINSNYIEKLQKWRFKNNLSMRKAAKILNVPKSTYIYWENNTYIISEIWFNKLKEKLKELGILNP